MLCGWCVVRIPVSTQRIPCTISKLNARRLHIPPYQWGSEGLHGPLQPCVCAADASSCKCPTSFPCPSALGTTFNDSLYFQIGQADGREARAINNLRNHATQNQYGDGIDYWSPTINMQRDPRWGRNQEVPGEDPMLTGNYAANFVQGLQGDVGGLDDGHTQITACCKHFIANSLEQWEGNTRYDFNAHVPYDDFRNYYLPPFRSCVQEGRARGVMCSYNAVTIDGVFDNVPSCANDWLLKKTLREDWRFDGYVTSDCGAIGNECQKEPQGHGYSNCTAAAANSIKAGTDVNCGGIYSSQIVNAVNASLLTVAEVDTSFARLTKIQMELGLFDNNKHDQKYFNLGIESIDTAEHQQLALEAAQQAVVLLRNKKDTLPLTPGAKIAIVGPHFNATDLLISNYHGSRCLDPGSPTVPGSGKYFGCITSPLDAIAAANGAGGWVKGAEGCSVAGTDGGKIAGAVALAASADVVIMALGIDQSQEREGHDRTITTFPGKQNELLEHVMALGKTKTILVSFSGGAMSLGKGAKAPAIISAIYGGEAAAPALADVLFGKYNPSGKLAATMYPADYVKQINLTEMGLTVGPGRTHMFYTGKPEFAFGTGLSYTSWSMEWAGSSTGGNVDIVYSLSGAADASPVSEVEVELANVGGRAGRQTLLCFWRPKSPLATGTKIQQKLVAYKGTGVEIAPGARASLKFAVSKETFALAASDSQDQDALEVAIGEYELVVSHGDHKQAITRTIKVVA